MEQNSENYCDFYKELADVLKNAEEVNKLYKHFRGLTITFPKKLYSKKYVNDYIKEYYGKISTSEIARHLDLSERRIRQIVKELQVHN